jgi:peptidoglycan hydrolase-like protein with peptidoglycan-binding domain
MVRQVDVFVSYAREDRPDAQALAAVLTGEGWNVWWDREVLVGQAFDREIEAALAEARAVVVLWSLAAADSPWVRAEAGEAAERGVLVPARLDDAEVPLRFRSVQTADLRGWLGDRPGGAGRAGLDDLVHAVRTLVGGPEMTPSTTSVTTVARASAPTGRSVASTAHLGAPRAGPSTRHAAPPPASAPRSPGRRRWPAVAVVTVLLGGAGAWALAGLGDDQPSERSTPATPDVPAAACESDLAVECRGPQVEELQRLLRAAGFDPGAVDGVFGSRTERALLDFEAGCDPCVVDGRIRVGSAEWSALASPAPDIAGDYHLDPDNARVIVITAIGERTYRIEEQLPANWPFVGTLTWSGGDRYEGDATFAAGGTMHVVVERMSDGRLDTRFRFLTDADGQPSTRVDPHTLVPIG